MAGLKGPPYVLNLDGRLERHALQIPSFERRTIDVHATSNDMTH